MPADGAAGCPPDVEAPLWAAFKHASAFASSSRAAGMLPPDDATKLALYGLFKRATVGTSEAGQAPGMFDFAGRAKHAAWRNNDRKTKAACMAEYVAMVEALTNGRWRAGDDAEAQTANPQTAGMGASVSVMAEDAGDDTDDAPIPDLHAAARSGFVPEVKYLLTEKHTPVDERDAEQRTALHWAADRGHAAVVDALVHANADVNARDNAGQTPLHYAALCEHEQVARALVAAGADVDATDDDGDTPRSLAPAGLLQ